MNQSPRTGIRPLVAGVAVIAAMLLGVGATLVITGLRSDTTTTSGSGELLVVSAETATVATAADQTYLTLTEVDPQSLWFTDRPQRLSGVMPTDILLEQWPQYFESSQPNAAMTFRSETATQSQSAPIPVQLGVPVQSQGVVRFPVTGLDGVRLPTEDTELLGPRLFIDPPAARLTDFHESPMLVPSVPGIPLTGGPAGNPDAEGTELPPAGIYVGGLPAARVGQKLVVVGPPSSISGESQESPTDTPPRD